MEQNNLGQFRDLFRKSPEEPGHGLEVLRAELVSQRFDASAQIVDWGMEIAQGRSKHLGAGVVGVASHHHLSALLQTADETRDRSRAHPEVRGETPRRDRRIGRRRSDEAHSSAIRIIGGSHRRQAPSQLRIGSPELLDPAHEIVCRDSRVLHHLAHRPLLPSEPCYSTGK